VLQNLLRLKKRFTVNHTASVVKAVLGDRWKGWSSRALGESRGNNVMSGVHICCSTAGTSRGVAGVIVVQSRQ
jgi:hypothetical protein